MTRRPDTGPDDIGRTARHFADMARRERRRDLIERIAVAFLFTLGGICAAVVLLIVLTILRGL